ncbi:949_t:CDS:2 [Gigaspora margarita]|uniref:949_t:CDS:1 n=1 Tax=Gigaspora margarita TaxID=4874 RepID=A0ABN7VFP2_GIGMA|nr:949_t:CDS:2 [Gigaspora margarita]
MELKRNKIGKSRIKGHACEIDDKIKEFRKIKVSKVDNKSDKKAQTEGDQKTFEKRTNDIDYANKGLGTGPKKGNEVERESSQNYLKYKIQKSVKTIIEKDEINKDNCSKVEELKKGFRLDDNSVNRMVVDKKNGISPIKDKKTKLE